MDDIRDVKVAFMVTLLQSVDSILWQIACNSVMNFLAWEQIISSELQEEQKNAWRFDHYVDKMQLTLERKLLLFQIINVMLGTILDVIVLTVPTNQSQGSAQTASHVKSHKFIIWCLLLIKAIH